MVTGIVYHQKYLEHEQSPSHPESRERLVYTIEYFEKIGIFDSPDVKILEPIVATPKDVLAVHHPRYVEFLRKSSEKGGFIDTDTVVLPGLFDIALLAAGGAIKAAKSVLEDEVNNAFAMIRPPGHHAHPYIGAGFCYLNNIAIAVRWLQRNGISRILILDFDAHHGDGTQEIFYEDESVLFISTHQMPLYPGTGYPEECGKGKGEGYTVNIPLPPGSGDECYELALNEIIKPLAEEFNPEFIAVSTGFDNHFTDPLTNLAITAESYTKMMSEVVDLSEKLCGGNIFAVLEGGYSVRKGLPRTMAGVVLALAGMDTSKIKNSEEYIDELSYVKRDDAVETVRRNIDTLKKYHSKYWEVFKK
ncbi:MAG TPA: histone deacetylase [Archaeoglobaceae archaeon]|nr:histone deacetylase [Archaeoglobaceae archaeon]